jgi:4-methyl-5(b-hydroxyethyl)-thiazole monophosphate biosynthesis
MQNSTPDPVAPPRVLVPAAAGVEDLEFITIVDILRRAGCEVVTAGLHRRYIQAARGSRLILETLLELISQEEFTAIVLPGGRPGADHLASDLRLREMLQRTHAAGGWVAALCAAPLALAQAELLQGRSFTCHPSVVSEFAPGNTPSNDRVVVDGHIITAQAAGSAMEFAMTLVEQLCGPAVHDQVRQGVLDRA